MSQLAFMPHQQSNNIIIASQSCFNFPTTMSAVIFACVFPLSKTAMLLKPTGFSQISELLICWQRFICVSVGSQHKLQQLFYKILRELYSY